MRLRAAFLFTAIFALAMLSASICHTQTPGGAPVKPPVAPVHPVTDDYYGTKIVDDYRYMENLKDPEVQEWFKNQNDYTRATLASIPGREKLLARIRGFDQSVPVVALDVRRYPCDLYFYRKLLAGEDIFKLYMRKGLGGEERLLVDPEKITLAASNREKGRNSLRYDSVSQDCRYVAVGITPGGSENDTELHIIETSTGLETGDLIFHALGSAPQWLPDNRSFLYNRLQDLPAGAPKTEIRQKLRTYLHVLGTDPKNDPAVFGYGVTPSIDVGINQVAAVRLSPDSKYAVGIVGDDVASSYNFYIERVDALGKSDSAWRKVADFSDSVAAVVPHDDDLYLMTSKDASRYKIIRIDARTPDLAAAEIVAPPSEAIIRDMYVAKDALYVQLMDGGVSRLLRVPYGPKPRVENLSLPMEGSVFVMGTDPRVPGILFGVSSWTIMGNLYAYDPQAKHVTNTKLEQFGPYDHDDNIKAVEVKVKSYDGALIPLSIVYPKGMKFDGSNPTILSGYGAYGRLGSSPGFDSRYIAWSERRGVRAACGVRGGGEYGEDWHLAGKGATKPNTWRDFIACAEYLIGKKYTSPAHLAGQGGSAGGILIGRAITERPDLFGVAIIQVSMLDMLRSETTANGIENIPEFGSTKTEEGFKALYAMSSYHHVKDGTPYPAVLLTTGINDPRVDPWESAKMTARLQAATSSGKPVLLRVDYAGGHGIGDTQNQAQRSLADILSFVLWQFGDPDFQPKVGK